jgi:hypothetical protein
MAAHRVLAHNPSLPSSVCCWSDLGENVGVGLSARSVHRAFMASAPHRANILSATFTQVGVGTAVGGDGRLYVDEVFRRPRSQPSTTSVAPVRRPVPVRASRGVRRTAVAAVPRAAVPGAALLDRRVARTRLRLAAAAAHADPVRRAVLYVTAVRAVAG